MVDINIPPQAKILMKLIKSMAPGLKASVDKENDRIVFEQNKEKFYLSFELLEAILNGQ